MKIITLNLNPVYDVFYSIPAFKPYKENVADSVSVFTGGKGMNVTRVLHTNGYKSIAYLLLGRENSQAFVDGITADGFESRIFYTEGRIRENNTILSNGIPETRICVDTFYANYSVIKKMFDEISKEADSDTIIVCSGKFPKGISRDEAVFFAKRLKEISKHLVLDSNTFTADDILEIKPWLIKPNEEEIEALVKKAASSQSELLSAAEELYNCGIPNVLISLGEKGAIYCGDLGKTIVSVPKITPVSTIGAGDSTVAGFISAYGEGLSLSECLRRACAFGTAACLEEGTNPPLPEKISFLSKQVSVKTIK